MILKIPKSGDKVIGAVRVSEDLYDKLKTLSKKAGVSVQEIIRNILINIIDEVEV